MRSLWPFRRLELRSRLSSEEVLSRLRAVLLDTPTLAEQFRTAFGHGLSEPAGVHFTGVVGQEVFRVRRHIQYYRNSFVPDVQGRLREVGEGTAIRVTMRLRPFVLVFMCLWMAIAIPVGVLGVVVCLAGKPQGLLLLLFPLIGGGMVGFGFRFEANIAERSLRRLLEAE